MARVFEVDPNTVLAWLVEGAEYAAAFSQYGLHDVRVTQVQLATALDEVERTGRRLGDILLGRG